MFRNRRKTSLQVFDFPNSSVFCEKIVEKFGLIIFSPDFKLSNTAWFPLFLIYELLMSLRIYFHESWHQNRFICVAQKPRKCHCLHLKPASQFSHQSYLRYSPNPISPPCLETWKNRLEESLSDYSGCCNQIIANYWHLSDYSSCCDHIMSDIYLTHLVVIW